MGQFGFYFDMNKCSGCKCCMVACMDENNSEPGYQLRKVTAFEGGVFPAVWAASLSIACNHCAKPACVENCLSGSFLFCASNTEDFHRRETVCIWYGVFFSVCEILRIPMNALF